MTSTRIVEFMNERPPLICERNIHKGKFTHFPLDCIIEII